MQNLTAREENHTAWDCTLCLQSPVFASLAPYVLICLPINGWVLWLMKSSPVFWTDRMEVFEFHLVLTELLVGILEIPLLISALRFKREMTQIMSKLVDAIFVARTEFQCSICIERYIAVVHPVLYLRFKLLRYRMGFSCVLWLQTSLICMIKLYLCSEDPISVGISTVCFVYVFVINSFCCLSVLRALKQPSPGEGERSNLIKRRAFNVVLIFLVIAVVGYAPMIIMLPMIGKINLSTLCILQPLAYCVMIWLGAIPPILYLRRAGKQLRNDSCMKCFQE